MGCFNAGTTWKAGQGVSCYRCGAKASLVNYSSDEKVWECSKTGDYIAEYMAGYSVVPKRLMGRGKKRSSVLRS